MRPARQPHPSIADLVVRADLEPLPLLGLTGFSTRARARRRSPARPRARGRRTTLEGSVALRLPSRVALSVCMTASASTRQQVSGQPAARRGPASRPRRGARGWPGTPDGGDATVRWPRRDRRSRRPARAHAGAGRAPAVEQRLAERPQRRREAAEVLGALQNPLAAPQLPVEPRHRLGECRIVLVEPRVQRAPERQGGALQLQEPERALGRHPGGSEHEALGVQGDLVQCRQGERIAPDPVEDPRSAAL